MTTAVTISPAPILQFLNGLGQPNVGGSILTQVGGFNAATYQDAAGTIPLPNPIPLNSRGEISNASGVSCQLFLTNGQIYTFTLFDALGNQLNQATSVTALPSTLVGAISFNGIPVVGTPNTVVPGLVVSSIASLRAQLKTGNANVFVSGYYTAFDGGGGSYSYDASDTTSADNGGSIIVASDGGRWKLDTQTGVYSAKQFGAKFDGVTDDTAAMIALITYVFNAGGGTILCPPGTCMVSSIAFNWNGIGTTVNIKGCGTLATYFKKIGATTTPIFSLTTTGIIGVYLTLEDFTVLGNNTFTHDGILANRIGYIKTRNVRITQCNNGWNSTGNLVTTHYNIELFANKVGTLVRKSSDGVYSNLVEFFGGVIKSNTTFGLDLGECNAFSFYSTDFELNGTSLNTGTGTFRIRSSIINEFGWANISLKSCWFELNVGDNFVVEAAANVDISLDDCLILFSEAAKGMNVGAIRSLVLKNTYCDGVVSAAASTTIIGGNITTPTVTSAVTNYIGAQVGGTTYSNFTGGIVLAPSTASILSGSYVSGQRIVYVKDLTLSGADSLNLYHVNGASGNVAACAAKFAASSVTSRSVNAGGTFNASGADYAEYEYKSASCGAIEKGAIVGFDKDGLLTDKFSESVLFGVKSTSPSYVGGDTWFDEEQNHDMESPEWAAQQARLEAARAKVDRIAYSGKVPVNVSGAKPGDHIDAAEGPNDTIVGLIAAQRSERTVGRVISIGADERPIVKVF